MLLIGRGTQARCGPTGLALSVHCVAQVQKNSAIVEQVVYAIAGAQIIKEPVEGGGKVGGRWYVAA